MSDLIIYYTSGGDIAEAESLARKINAEITENFEETKKYRLVLSYSEDGVSLFGGGQTLKADFSHMIGRIKSDNLKSELLVRTAKFKGEKGTLTAIDATAGFGEDSLLLAAVGFCVDLYEYNPIIAALLKDALRRSGEIPELADAVSRMTLCERDSIEALNSLTVSPNLILLDPMFPPRKKTALVKKKFQLIHLLETPCKDEKALLDAAIKVRPEKIIIKRPLKGPYLSDIQPSYTIKGKAIRYDCIVLPPL